MAKTQNEREKKYDVTLKQNETASNHGINLNSIDITASETKAIDAYKHACDTK